MKTLLAMLALVTLTACGNDRTTGPESASVVGAWALQSVDGKPLPYAEEDEGVKTEVTSGTINFAQSGSYSVTLVFRVSFGSTVNNQSLTEAGTYTTSGNTVTLTSTNPGDPSISATITGNNTLTFSDGAANLVFKKT